MAVALLDRRPPASTAAARLEAALKRLGPRVDRAVRLAHHALLFRGIDHILIGRIAAVAHGCELPVNGIEYGLAGGRVLTADGEFIGIPDGLPHEVEFVRVGYSALLNGMADWRLRQVHSDETLPPLLCPEALIVLALRAGDHAAVEALLRIGADRDETERLVSSRAPLMWRSYADIARRVDRA